jgi:exosortase A-associated hydrolase 1
MRRLLTVRCEGAQLGATIDGDRGSTGLLFVTGGTQTRIGSHRLFERLAAALAASGHPCFRFDRRGVGDSEGADPGWRGSAEDIKAAATAFRRERRGLDRIVGLGLCDGASALALFGAQAGLQGAILVNPWFVESEADAPPAAAIRSHYRTRLLSADGWKRIASGSVDYKKLFRGVRKIAGPGDSDLGDEVASAIEHDQIPVALVLAGSDATAIAAADIWGSKRFKRIREASAAPFRIESDSHTFAREGDEAALLQACLTALTVLSRRG